MGVRSITRGAKPVLVIATRNLHKVAEIKKILRLQRIDIKLLSDFPTMPEVVEDGKTLEANAIKKAVAIMQALNLPALSDDSGLFVPKLAGEPGVRSARYAGLQCDYSANNQKLLRKMKTLRGRERRAFFATTMALAIPGKKVICRTGKIWGKITESVCGENGFGYDPVFIPRASVKTFAEMHPNEKNEISHRALALQRIAAVIQKQRIFQ